MFTTNEWFRIHRALDRQATASYNRVMAMHDVPRNERGEDWQAFFDKEKAEWEMWKALCKRTLGIVKERTDTRDNPYV